MQALGQHCRDWRDRNQSKSKVELEWSVKIYAQGANGKTQRSTLENPPPGLLFMPLASPPSVIYTPFVGKHAGPELSEDEVLEKWGNSV